MSRQSLPMLDTITPTWLDVSIFVLLLTLIIPSLAHGNPKYEKFEAGC